MVAKEHHLTHPTRDELMTKMRADFQPLRLDGKDRALVEPRGRQLESCDESRCRSAGADGGYDCWAGNGDPFDCSEGTARKTGETSVWQGDGKTYEKFTCCTSSSTSSSAEVTTSDICGFLRANDPNFGGNQQWCTCQPLANQGIQVECLHELFRIGDIPFDVGIRYKFDPCLLEGESLMTFEWRELGRWVQVVKVPAYGQTSSNILPGAPIVYWDLGCWCTLRLKFKMDVTVTGDNRAAVVRSKLHFCDKAGEAGEQCNRNVRGLTGLAVGAIFGSDGIDLGATGPMDFGECPSNLIIPTIIGGAVLVVVIIGIIVYCRCFKKTKKVASTHPPAPTSAVVPLAQGTPMPPMTQGTPIVETSPSKSTGVDLAKLKELKELFDAGVLTQAEFDAQKKIVLGTPA